MPSKAKIATKFANQLLEAYNSGVHILDCFKMFMGFISLFGGHAGGKDLKRCTSWQMKDLMMSIWNDKIDYRLDALETVWNKNRRSGKTKGGTLLAVFFALLDKQVKWRSAYLAQQKEAKVWFYLNPFVKKISRQEGRVYLSGKSYYPIDLAVLSPGNVTGVECDVAIFDEGGWVFKGLQLYEAYKNARPMIAASDFKHILHLSTPARSSAFQEAWDETKSFEEKLGTQLTVLRTVHDCPWITPEFIEGEKRKHADCPWYIEQNYYGVFVVYGGAVFDNFYDINDSVHVNDQLYDWFRRVKPDYGGVDWNGEFTKHFLGLYYITEDYIFAKKEIKFLDIELLRKYEVEVSLELEDDDPFSNAYADTAKELGIKCNYFGWSNENKMERVRQAKSRIIIVDKKECPILWKNLQEAAYDQNSRLPMLEKRPDQHGLDDMLHALHGGPGVLTIPREMKLRQRTSLFGDTSRYAMP